MNKIIKKNQINLKKYKYPNVIILFAYHINSIKKCGLKADFGMYFKGNIIKFGLYNNLNYSKYFVIMSNLTILLNNEIEIFTFCISAETLI